MKCVKLLVTFFIIFSISHKANAKAYFEASVISPTLIDPPLAKESEEWKNEIKHIVNLQKNASQKELKKAGAERDLTPEMVAQEVDPELTREKKPQLYYLLDRVSETSHGANRNAKFFWNTERPYIADKKVKSLIDAHASPAYPSGHTCGSYVLAHVLGLLMPEKRAKFQARAEEIAQHRVLVGMHFPHDLVGGRQMALLVVGALMENEDFQADLKKAREAK
jgi:acid phosphatase (class A)